MACPYHRLLRFWRSTSLLVGHLPCRSIFTSFGSRLARCTALALDLRHGVNWRYVDVHHLFLGSKEPTGKQVGCFIAFLALTNQFPQVTRLRGKCIHPKSLTWSSKGPLSTSMIVSGSVYSCFLCGDIVEISSGELTFFQHG